MKSIHTCSVCGAESPFGQTCPGHFKTIEGTDGKFYAVTTRGEGNRVYEVIMTILMKAACEMVDVDAITLSARSFEALHTETCARNGWPFDPEAKNMSVHGPRGPVKIVRGQ